ncbi:MAG: 3'(2'),5'-bisphosphate nucleotidase CysQ [Rikenellaceae bacterium]
MIDKSIKEHLLTNIVNAAIQAGAAIMQVYNSETECSVDIKSDNTPITEADRAAHNAIKEALGATRIPILSEEGREMLYDERRNWEMFWLVDPLDGTVEFINRNNEFTVNIALMSEGEAVLGVIFVPCLKQLFVAARGYGASITYDVEPNAASQLTYEQICANVVRLPLESSRHEHPRVAVSRSHNTPETYTYINKLKQLHPDLEVIEQGSSYKFALLAQGVVDYYVRTTHTFEWDTAAGELILDEAGGATTAIPSGEKLRYNKEHLQNPWFQCEGVVKL